MYKDKKFLTNDQSEHLPMNFSLEKINSGKKQNLIQILIKGFVGHIQRIDHQIKNDMDFCFKYRPSRWLSFIAKRNEKSIQEFIHKKKHKKLLFYTTIVFLWILFGFLPTFKFLFWFLFKLSLFVILIPFTYWALAICVVYARVIVINFVEFIFIIRNKLIDL